MEYREAFGIDIGFDYSCAGIFKKNGKVEIATNEVGIRTTPSFITFRENEILIGTSSLNIRDVIQKIQYME